MKAVRKIGSAIHILTTYHGEQIEKKTAVTKDLHPHMLEVAIEYVQIVEDKRLGRINMTNEDLLGKARIINKTLLIDLTIFPQNSDLYWHLNKLLQPFTYHVYSTDSLFEACKSIIQLYQDAGFPYPGWPTLEPEPLTIHEQLLKNAEQQPVRLSNRGKNDDWIYKEFHYITNGPYDDEQFSLLILEEFDKERRLFEDLKRRHLSTDDQDQKHDRPRVPENIRIEVWRRDGGKCARCGSRENLEYDHIVPISKGGSNTARNIELLCEKCNRSKSNNVV